MNKSKIEWTDYSWNFVTGCSKVSAGCKNCYAETMANRFWKDRKFTDVRIDESKLELPLHLKKTKMIFVNSMGDLFHEKVSFDVIDKVFEIMVRCLRHKFQILTKRPERMLRYISQTFKPQYRNEYMLNNIWLGVSVENQQTADERITMLLQTPAAVRWLSIEPILEDIFIARHLASRDINWVVVGAESGYNRRECKIEWVESIVDQCKQANVPVFVKQLQINSKVIKDINQFPKYLRVREYPRV